MRKTFKYRLYPSKAQRSMMQKTLDACRWVYNKTLEWRQTAYAADKTSFSLFASNAWLLSWKKSNPHLTIAHSQVLQNAQERVDLALKAFFRRVKRGETPGYPRFRGRGWYDSFTYPQSGFWIEDGFLRLSKIGNIKIKLHRPIEGKIKTLTIRRDRLGNWYACFSCEVDPEPLPYSGEVAGIDLGLTTFATFSNEETIERERWFARDTQDIARLQRKKELFPKGSAERRKVIRALQHAYQRAANRRSNFAHQESRKLINRYGLIVFEDLNIQDMQETGYRTIRKGIADVAWGQFVQFAAYKAESAGRGFLCVPPRGTTQQCSGCSAVVPKDLSERVHSCPHCGLTLGRDLNAARNILARGMASLSHRAVEALSFS